MMVLSKNATGPLTQKEIETQAAYGTRGLHFYKVNNNLIADYIEVGNGKFIDQRIIRLRNEKGDKEVRLTINPSESNNTVTQNNFDGLMELVGSIKFTD
jgi:hypothetical protein